MSENRPHLFVCIIRPKKFVIAKFSSFEKMY